MTNPTNPEVAILNAALELPADQRAAYLDKACTGDVVLRAQVEALLAVHDHAAGFLEGSSATFDFKRTARVNIPLTEKPGDRIGRYKLLQQIGEGGCGVVYMAEQEEPVRRRVALKVIKLGMDTKSVIARFEAERQALAMMDHPNIAKVLDAGATETGRPYFVMELVRGVKITTYCDQQKLAMRQRLDLFIQVCQAVQHAHQKGIIHRDLKPSNILVTEQDGAPMPKIIDFGIAKATTDQRLTDKTLFTAFEQFLGTPAYMSPEQAGLGGLDIDTRSDIYSLGVLLYELLTGQPPFDAEQFSRSALHEILRVIRESEPPRPSARLTTLTEQELTTAAQRRQIESTKLPNLVRGDLDWIVMKALDKDRTRRYETANGFARDLQRFLDNEAVVARPPSNFYRLQKLVRRNKLSFAAVGAVTLTLLLGLGMSTWLFLKERTAERAQARLRQEAEAARHQAEADKQAAKTEAAKSQQVAQFLKDMLQGVDASVAMGRDTKLLLEILEKTANRAGRDLQAQPDVRADLEYTIAEVYYGLSEWTKAETLHREALKIRRELAGDPLTVAASLDALAYILYSQVINQNVDQRDQKKQIDEAERLNREALNIRQAHLGVEHADIAHSLIHLAIVLRSEGKLTEAEAMGWKAVSMGKKLLPEDDPRFSLLLGYMAKILRDQGKLSDSERMYRDSLSACKKAFGEEHPSVAGSLLGLASVLARQGNLLEAEDLCRQAFEMRTKFLGDVHAFTIASLDSLIGVLRAQHKWSEAVDLSRRNLQNRRKLWGNEHRFVANGLHNLANALSEQGKQADAETMMREALAMRIKLLGNEHPDVAMSLCALAEILREQGKLAEAETTQQEGLSQHRKFYSEAAERGNVMQWNDFAWFLATCADPAFRDGAKAVTFAEKAVAVTQRKNVSYMDTLAAAYAEAGEFAKAVSTQKEAIVLSPSKEEKEALTVRLKLYESNAAYHEP